MSDLSLFDHIFVDVGSRDTLILLHGTGADKNDLLPLGGKIAPGYNLLSLSGNVLDRGMRRFFVRFPSGEFDLVSISQEAEKLFLFLGEWKNGHVDHRFSWLGYSNGANMILAMLFLYPDLVRRGVLLHPMLPLDPPEIDLSQKEFVVTLGKNDQMIPFAEGERVVKVLSQFGAKVETVTHEGGHEIRREELERVEWFLQKNA